MEAGGVRVLLAYSRKKKSKSGVVASRPALDSLRAEEDVANMKILY
jgi:hypothetical protein